MESMLVSYRRRCSWDLEAEKRTDQFSCDTEAALRNRCLLLPTFTETLLARPSLDFL